jgi:rubredoxin
MSESPTPETPASAAPEAPVAPGVKTRLPFQRACNEKNAKGKLCSGHLKRWYAASADLKRQHGEDLYRCEHCHTIYKPAPGFEQRTGTLQF